MMGGETGAEERVRYADLKPYSIVDDLDDLKGPKEDSLSLPVKLLWVPGSRVKSTDVLGELKSAYQAVLSEGSSADIEKYVNKDLLIEVWRDLSLPARVAKMWEDRFSALTGNMRASW